MKEFTVVWAIQIWAEGMVEAAEQARDIMQDTDSTALVFKVRDKSTKRSYQVDLFENTITPE